MRRKICVVVTARPSYPRIYSALRAIHNHPDLELLVVTTASALLDRYGEVVNVIEDEGFVIAERLYTALEGENLVTAAKTTGLGLIELSTTFDRLKPDAVLTIADRFETMATAIAAAYLNIPLVHIQGGEVTGSIDEKVRHAVTKLADYHFVATEKAADRVLMMGENPAQVFITGCPSIDIVAEIMTDPRLDFDPMVRYGGVGGLRHLPDEYLVVLQHPVTTDFGQARQQFDETLQAVYESGLPALWFWPNIDAGSDEASRAIRAFREQYIPQRLHFFKNMVPTDFLRLLYNSKCVVGNSSVAIRECSFMGVPTVNIGARQAGRERAGNVYDVDHDRDAILRGIQIQTSNGRFAPSTLYGAGQAGLEMANLLATVPLCFEKQLTY